MKVRSPSRRSYCYSEVRARLQYDELRYDAERLDERRAELLHQTEAVGDKIERRFGPQVREALVAPIASWLGGPSREGSPHGTERTQRESGTFRNRCGKGKDTCARMLNIISRNRESLEWTLRQWAERLRCSAGTIGETEIWKEYLPYLRAKEQSLRVRR